MPFADPDERRAFQRAYYKRNQRQKELRRQASMRWLRRRRERILERDNYTCHYCGVCYRDEPRKLTVDHKRPILRQRDSDGVRRPKQKDDSDDNRITACRSCNQRKGVKSYEFFMAEMQPNRVPDWVIGGWLDEGDDEWRDDSSQQSSSVLSL